MSKYTYMPDEVARQIVVLGTGRGGPIVGNERIYQLATSLQRFSKPRWSIFKPVLIDIAKQREFVVDGVKYQLQSYQPMLANRFNFWVDEHLDLMYRKRACAGFTVFRQETEQAKVGE